MNTKRKFIFNALLFILISGTPIVPESRANEFYFLKIMPSKAFFILDRLNHEGNSSIYYRVLLEFQEEYTISDAERENFRNPLLFKNFCIADISVPDIFRIVKSTSIRKIYVLNRSQTVVGSTHEKAKTVIGIIDQGIDWKNECFMKCSGKESRIISIWDQNGKGYEPISNCIPYGTEYLEHDIKASLKSNCNLIPYEAGHGWIISAVAAGNVTIQDEQKNELFPGKTIDLPIIMVNTTGKMAALLDAVAYITRKAAQMKSKCVINFALCKHIGPHDSSYMYLRAIDALMDENSLLVVAAGNEGLKNIYIREKMNPRALLEFRISKQRYGGKGTEINCKVEIEVWYNGSSHNKISLISPRGKVYGPVEQGEYNILNSMDGTIFIANGIDYSSGSDKKGANISITSYERQTPRDGKWSLLMESSGKSIDKKIEAWITKSKNCDTEFKTKGNMINTISFLAFSKKTVSVGSWMYDESNLLKEADFSNNPCKNMDCPEPLPNVLAPGRVYVNIPGFSNPMQQDGTSVSTALITRFIAQTWNENPGLKASDIKKNLNGKVMTLNNSSSQWNGSPDYRLSRTANTFITYFFIKEKEIP
ncbi:MAG: S8 family serine peptidase [Candidatus Aminicenantes bacterium]|jgi:hypothetical protein